MPRQLLLLLLLLCNLWTSAQPAKDFGVWASLGYEKEILPPLDASVEGEFRLEDNSRKLGRFFTEFELQYHIVDALAVSAAYRWIADRDKEDYWGIRHRYLFNLDVEQRLRRFELGFRQRFRYEQRGYGYFDTGPPEEDYYTRSTVDASYTINRYYQLWTRFDFRFSRRDPDAPNYTGFDRLRIKVGVDRQLTRRQSVSFFLMYSGHYFIPEPDREIVIGLEYAFNDGYALFPD